jgi:hypothetical protein
MDPNSGRLYDSVEAAKEAGVENPVEITGRPEDVKKVSDAVAARAELTRLQTEAKKKKRQEQKASRKKNR